MSVEAANHFIKKYINKELPALRKVLDEEYRKDILDKRITILDISPESLSVNLDKEHTNVDFVPLYGVFFSLVQEALTGVTYPSLTAALDVLGEDRVKASTFLVNASPTKRFIVGKNYRSIREFVTKYVSNSDELRDTIFGLREEWSHKKQVYVEKSFMDIGHISSPDNENLTSPAEEKIKAVQLFFKDNKSLVAEADLALKELYDIQLDFSYDFRNTTPDDIAVARGVLGEAYLVVTLHTHAKNMEFAKKELAVYNRVLRSIASHIKLEQVPGSNTILEDIAARLRYALGIDKKPPVKHAKVSGKIEPIKPKPVKSGSTTTTSKSTIKPPLRDLNTGRFTSLASLQVLLDRHLQDVLSANMGDEGYPGGQRRILNYRTGRFASSAKVERLVQSKTGMITAFYTYMKNPYATFSTGGAQQYPKTRDPKLLISKSIHEIAATLVGNRLRAVVI